MSRRTTPHDLTPKAESKQWRRIYGRVCRPFEDEQHTSNDRCVLPPSSFCVARLIAAESPARRAFTGKRVTFAADRRLLFSPRHGHIPEKNLCSESLVFLIIYFQMFFFYFLTFSMATLCVLILGLNVKDEGYVRTNNRIASL